MVDRLAVVMEEVLATGVVEVLEEDTEAVEVAAEVLVEVLEEAEDTVED